VPITFQAKLLRFIETRKYQVLGEPEEREADVRILAATNRDLKLAIRENQFREDLYFRLQVLEIEIPPLRKRKQDIRELVLENRELLKGKEIDPGFWEGVFAYDWPGNTRELLTVLTRAGIHSASTITGNDIQDVINRSFYKGISTAKDDKIEQIRVEINEGKNFWQLVWRPFIDREIDRNTVKTILQDFYQKNSCSFKKMIKSMNLDEKDYQKFMSLLYQYKIDPRD
jgi:transcriptional regulator with PAS, ATPase and Fis domain